LIKPVQTSSVVTGQGQGHGTVRDRTVQDMFYTFYVQDIFGTIYKSRDHFFLYE
jgi:hypothetical protein